PRATNPARARRRPQVPRTACSVFAPASLTVAMSVYVPRSRGPETSDVELPDADRRAERHQLEEPQERRVPHPDAAVRDAAGQDLGLVRPVNPDEAAAGPVGQARGFRVQPERPWAVPPRVIPGELLGHVQLSARRRPLGLPDADPRRKDGPPVPVERGPERALR